MDNAPISSGMKTYRLVMAALFTAVAAIFQLTHNILGIPTGFGMTVDLVSLPVLLAFFLFGFDLALLVCILTAIIITLISPETWLGASMKFAGTLPMILLPALWLLSGKKKTDPGRISAIVLLSITISLFLFVFSGILNTSSNPIFQGMNQTIYNRPNLTAGGSVLLEGGAVTPETFLQGVIPILGLSGISWIMFYLWRRYGKGVDIISLSKTRNILIVTSLAVFVRGISMIVANFYYAGPVFYGISAQDLVAASLPIQVPFLMQDPVNLPLWFIIFFWNVVQGVVEILFAWTIAFKFRFFNYYGSY